MMDEGLKSLLDYTIFHIGIYITLGAAIIAADMYLHRSHWLMKVAVSLLLLAGLAAGMVASNIPAASRESLAFFLDQNPVLFCNQVLTIVRHRHLTQIEHAAFWLAVLTLWVPFLLHRTTPPIANGRKLQRESAVRSVNELLANYEGEVAQLSAAVSAIETQIASCRADLQARIEQLAASANL